MCLSKFPELFAKLAAPFEPGEVKVRTQANRQLSYVTARTVMNRLDNVLGPENWWDTFQPHNESVFCSLTIRLPDGSTVTKCDAGGYAGMTDQGDDDKSGYSDSLKRAAVKFGVGRYLYRDGVPEFVETSPAPAPPPRRAETHAPDPPRREPGESDPPGYSGRLPENGRQLYAWVMKQQNAGAVGLLGNLNKWGKARGLPWKTSEYSPQDVELAVQMCLDYCGQSA